MSLLLHNLLGMKPKGFGLETEDRSLKAFMFDEAGRKCRILSCGMKNLKRGIIQDGQVIDVEALAAEIKELLKSTKPHPIKTKSVVFSVPENKAFIRTISIPKMGKDEAGEAIKWETEANIPIAVDRVYLDWQVVEERGESNEILVTAVPKEIIDKYSEAMNLAGLDILAVEVDIIATIRSLTGDDHLSEKPVVIVDLGESVTSLAISKNQVPYFTSSLPVGGITFTDALQKGLGVSYEKAEELKLKYGLGKMKEDDILYKIYNPIIENLVAEIEKSIRFYEDSINVKEKVEKLILSGGGSLLHDIVGYLTLRMKKEVIVGDAVRGLDLPKNFSEEIKKSLTPFATAIGLAERATSCDD
ncbi:MAG: type IV pilus assembly protein PilM [Candidatus Moranbacteria bacterium]|nr:type IV pilus assembly protein PilM [Candidatus Moranbacteria bacterium]